MRASSLDLMSRAAELALIDAGLLRSEIDGILCGYSTVSPHIMLATVFAEHFGIQPSMPMQVGGATSLAMAMRRRRSEGASGRATGETHAHRLPQRPRMS